MRELLRRVRGRARHEAAPAESKISVGLAPARSTRRVEGVIVAVERRSTADDVPAVVALVRAADGDETALIWLGRRAIGGIVEGARLRARGLATTVRTRPTIYNPSYDLMPSPAQPGSWARPADPPDVAATPDAPGTSNAQEAQ